jgi:hypothetical protein
MGDGDTLRSLTRTCGRHKSGQINVSDLIINMKYNTFNSVNVLIFRLYTVSNKNWRHI